MSPGALALHSGTAPTVRGAVALYYPRLSTMGGAQRMAFKLADGLQARGHDVHLVSCDTAEANASYRFADGVAWRKLGRGSRATDKLARTFRLAKYLSEVRPKALIGFVMSGDKTVYAAAKLTRTPLVAAERNAPSMYMLRYGRMRRWSNLALLHLCRRIVVQQPGFIEGYPATLRERMAVIPNAVEPAGELARPATRDERGRFVVLAVGRLDGVQKRLGLLVRAFAGIAAQHRDWDLRIVGDGPDRGLMEEEISRRGLTDRVFLAGEKDDVFSEYRNAHVFAIPSLWEGFPNALAEAMSHGLPAVGFRDASGVSELIEDGVTGWLADGRDSEAAFADALTHAFGDERGRVARGLRASASMRRFAPDSQFDRWAMLIDGLSERAR